MSARANGFRARLSLRAVVPAVSALLLAVALLTSAFVAERQTRALLASEARSRLALEAELLARASASSMLEGFPELTLQPMVQELLKGRDDLASAMVLDREGRVLAHPDARRIGTHEDLPEGGERLGGAAIVAGEATLTAVVPVRHPSGTALGRVAVSMPRAPLERALAAARARQWWIAAGLLLVSAALTFALMSGLLRPISRLREGLERIGRGDLETRLALRDHTELGMLADTLDDMAARLSEAQRAAIDQQRMAAELEAAGRIQASLHLRGVLQRGPFEVLGHQRPAAEVGGDYFDAFPLADGRLGMVVADVSGKGLSGCLVTFMLAALVRSTRDRFASPRELLLEVDRNLRPVLERGAFVTVWYGVLDPHSGRLTFASAGHLPTMIRRADGRVERFASRSIPLGIVNAEVLARGLQDGSVLLEPGDVLLQVTDGFTEAVGPDRVSQLGLEGVEDVLAAADGQTPLDVVSKLCERVETWTAGGAPDDDQTVLVLRRSPAPMTWTGLEDLEAVTWVARARAAEHHLRLAATLSELEHIGPWLDSIDRLAGMDPQPRALLESALYEVCGNIVEHGYANSGKGHVDVYWLPDATAAAGVARGRFAILERGRVFDPTRAVPSDVTDRRARLKGRGLGLAMLRRLLPGLAYRPDTPDGHLTLLDFDSALLAGTNPGDSHERIA